MELTKNTREVEDSLSEFETNKPANILATVYLCIIIQIMHITIKNNYIATSTVQLYQYSTVHQLQYLPT